MGQVLKQQLKGTYCSNQEPAYLVKFLDTPPHSLGFK